MEWVRGDTIGCGSFGTVNLVVPKNGFSKSPLMAVKSCQLIDSVSLKNEKEVLDRIGSCPQIIRCLGGDYAVEKRGKLYNLFLEYADKGSLADQVKKSGGNLMESDVRRYTRSILKGLRFVHSKGFVHCDIKLQNVLLFGIGDVKIDDFVLAKKIGEEEEGEQRRMEIRGTPLNIAPELVTENVYDSAVDIWALGCAVVEMFTGKPAWNFKPGTNMAALLIKIGLAMNCLEFLKSYPRKEKIFSGKASLRIRRSDGRRRCSWIIDSWLPMRNQHPQDVPLKNSQLHQNALLSFQIGFRVRLHQQLLLNQALFLHSRVTLTFHPLWIEFVNWLVMKQPIGRFQRVGSH